MGGVSHNGSQQVGREDLYGLVLVLDCVLVSSSKFCLQISVAPKVVYFPLILSGLGHPSLFAWPSFNSVWLQTFWVFPHLAPGQAVHPESTVGSSIPLPQQVPWLASGSQLCVHVMGTTAGFGVQIKFFLFLSPREGPQHWGLLTCWSGATRHNSPRIPHGQDDYVGVWVSHCPLSLSLIPLSLLTIPQAKRTVFFYFFSITSSFHPPIE